MALTNKILTIKYIIADKWTHYKNGITTGSNVVASDKGKFQEIQIFQFSTFHTIIIAMAMMLGSQHVATNATFTILICITQENKPNSPVQEDPMELYHIYIYIW